MSVQVSYKKQIFFGVMLLFFLFLVIEGLAQIYDYFFITNCKFTNSDAVKHLDITTKKQICNDHNSLKFHNDELHTQFVPNQHFPTVNINEHGFRGPEFIQIKSENTFRIFLLGGSTAFGSGSTSDEATIAGFLQNKFESQDLPFNVEVINAGIPAVASYTEHWLIKNKLIHLEPDLFIIYNGANDAGRRTDNYGISHFQHLRELQNQTNTSLKHEKENSTFESIKEIFRIIKITNFISEVKENFLYSVGIYNVPIRDETPIQEKASIWKERWKEICVIGNANGFGVFITVQPVLGTGNSLLTEHYQKMYTINNIEWFVERLEFYAEALNELDEYCTKTKDLRNTFDGIKEPIFLDPFHLNDYGNEIVSQELFELALPIVKESVTNKEK